MSAVGEVANARDETRQISQLPLGFAVRSRVVLPCCNHSELKIA